MMDIENERELLDEMEGEGDDHGAPQELPIPASQPACQTTQRVAVTEQNQN